mgnify:FL=1
MPECLNRILCVVVIASLILALQRSKGGTAPQSPAQHRFREDAFSRPR